MTEVSKLEVYKTLSARDRDAIIRHDVRNLLAYTVLGASQLAKEGYMRRIKTPNFDFLGVGQMFALHDRVLDQLSGVHYTGYAIELINLLDNIETKRELGRAVRDSVDFLENPADYERYKKLRERKIPLKPLPCALLVDSAPRNDRDATGPEVICIGNQLGNAREASKTYGSGNELVNTRITKNSFIIANYSRDPLPTNPFELGATINGMGYGYGLFIAAMYAEMEGIKIIPSCVSAEFGYRVTFTNKFPQQVTA